MEVFPKATSKHTELNNLPIVAFVKPSLWNLCSLFSHVEGLHFKLLGLQHWHLRLAAWIVFYKVRVLLTKLLMLLSESRSDRLLFKKFSRRLFLLPSVMWYCLHSRPCIVMCSLTIATGFHRSVAPSVRQVCKCASLVPWRPYRSVCEISLTRKRKERDDAMGTVPRVPCTG